MENFEDFTKHRWWNVVHPLQVFFRKLGRFARLSDKEESATAKRFFCTRLRKILKDFTIRLGANLVTDVQWPRVLGVCTTARGRRRARFAIA